MTTTTLQQVAIAQREAATKRQAGTAVLLTQLRLTRNWEEALIQGVDPTSEIMFSVSLRGIKALESYLPDAGRARYVNLRLTANGLWCFLSHRAVASDTVRLGQYSLGDISNLTVEEQEGSHAIRARGATSVQFANDSGYSQLELRVSGNSFSLWAIKA